MRIFAFSLIVPSIVSSAACAALSAACAAQPEYFRPTERAEGETAEGFAEAIYDITVPPEATPGTSARLSPRLLGETKVWSRGAYRAHTGGQERTIIEIGFEVENHSDAAMTLDALRLESVQTRRGIYSELGPVETTGTQTILPRTVGQARVHFVLPPAISPRDVDAFRVGWSLRTNGELYSQFTPFAQDETRYAYVPTYGYFYPYYPLDYPFYYPYPLHHRHRVVIVRTPRHHVAVPPVRRIR